MPETRAGRAQPATTFDDVYRAEYPTMVRIAYVSVGSRAIAEEIVHDAFVRLHDHLATVDNPGGFVRVAVVRLCATWHKRHRMERDRLALVAKADRSDDPDIDETWDALATLAPERRVVVALRYYEDLSHDEIARLLGVPTATVRTRLWRALRDLRKELER
jgi:RNA polymerase sigma-70 factor (ECF subfamily)